MSEVLDSFPVDVDVRAMVRRVTDCTMRLLELNPLWRNPIARLAIHVAVERNVLEQVRAGQMSEEILCETALACVRDDGRA